MVSQLWRPPRAEATYYLDPGSGTNGEASEASQSKSARILLAVSAQPHGHNL